MSRRKRSSQSVDNAETRAASLESIDLALDLGNQLTLAAYKGAIASTNAMLSAYNTRLSELDGLSNELDKAETALDELSSRMLAGVGVKYTKNSNEYEKAGGTRPDEHKSAHRATAVTSTPETK